jgi:hypothetical protein
VVNVDSIMVVAVATTSTVADGWTPQVGTAGDGYFDSVQQSARRAMMKWSEPIRSQTDPKGILMKKLIVATLSALVLVVGGSAAGVSAQVVEGEPEIIIDNPAPAPGDTVNVGVGNLEPETEVGVELGDQVAEGVADADGNASIPITIPANVDLGELDGIVSINGVDYPISVVVAAVAEAAGTGDGTPQPTAVNTGDGSSSSSNSMVLFAAAAGLLVIGGGAMTLRRRSTMS